MGYHEIIITIFTAVGALSLMWLRFGTKMMKKIDCDTRMAQIDQKFTKIDTTLRGSDGTGGLVKTVTETAVIVRELNERHKKMNGL